MMYKLILPLLFIIISDVLFCSNIVVVSFPIRRSNSTNFKESIELIPNLLDSKLVDSKAQHKKGNKSDNSNTTQLDKNKYEEKYNQSSGKHNEEEMTRNYHEKGSKGYDNYEEFHNKDAGEYGVKSTEINNNKNNDKNSKGSKDSDTNKLSNKVGGENAEKLTQKKFSHKLSDKRSNSPEKFDSINSKKKKKKYTVKIRKSEKMFKPKEHENFPENDDKHKLKHKFPEIKNMQLLLDEDNTSSLKNNNGGYESYIIHGENNSNEDINSVEKENFKKQYSKSSAVVQYYPLDLKKFKYNKLKQVNKPKPPNNNEPKHFQINKQIKNLTNKIEKSPGTDVIVANPTLNVVSQNNKKTKPTEKSVKKQIKTQKERRSLSCSNDDKSEEENLSLKGNSSSGNVKSENNKKKAQAKGVEIKTRNEINNIAEAVTEPIAYANVRQEQQNDEDASIEDSVEDEVSGEIVEDPKIIIPKEVSETSTTTKNINVEDPIDGEELEESEEENEEEVPEPEEEKEEELDELYEDDSDENTNNIIKHAKETEETAKLMPRKSNIQDKYNNSLDYDDADEEDTQEQEKEYDENINYDEDKDVTRFIGDEDYYYDDDDDEEDDEIQKIENIYHKPIKNPENLSDECEEDCDYTNSETDDE